MHASLLYSAPDLQLARVTCDGHDGPRPREEGVDSERLVLALHGRFQYRDSRTRAVVSPGVGLRLGPQRPCEIRHPHGGGDACLSVRGAWLRHASHSEASTLVVSTEAYVRIQEMLAHVARGEPVERVQVEETLGLILTPGERGPLTVSPRERDIAHAIAHEAALHFDARVSVEALAASAGVSAFHACRVFRKVTGTGIHQHLQEVRLRHALALLLDTRLPLADVALEAGFANQGHLGNAFRRRYGQSPGAARKARSISPE
ncbi:helix-turn-helix transcriptional regulator [Myxococcus sp. K38C18041901]|uniref:helix-turn-helix transcriptional regulator n=1 Tax=Myxococcus guangdongensis TaxID=2906760 RepID=UPI0020A76CF2|nr:helix-turn-helix transcriptional regulator [Myxococcus guangdongensis]MCP3059164.1 helix-turn-helix transcriptional regulator [Myxococcus guangdongensis]